MGAELLSVGLDVGTTTTQLVVSRLRVQNRASAFGVPDLQIRDREVVYRSPVYMTPILEGELVDGQRLRELVRGEYTAAGIRPEEVDTGAVIITGETSRKENAASVLAALAESAGKFVVATAGPDLESVLAAKGAGADLLSEQTGKPVLHMDIGGGTSNLALCVDGKIVKTGCLNVGGRLLRLDPAGKILYVSPVLREHIAFREGDTLCREQVLEIARLLASALEMAAGLRPPTALLGALTTREAVPWEPVSDVLPSFSGGVADCISREKGWLEFGDMGPELGTAIRESKLCAGSYRLGKQTIRATVIGAGCHSTQLSGSTVYMQNTKLPLQNLPVFRLTEQEQVLPAGELSARIRQKLETGDAWGILSLPGWNSPGYGQIQSLAEGIARAMDGRPCYIALEQDMAKALGHALALRLPEGAECICIDGVRADAGSYLDIGAPVGPAIAVTVKTLIFGQ